MASPGRVYRFSLASRLFHWGVALPVLLLFFTGFVIFFPALSVAIGYRTLIKDLHLYGALVLVLLPLLVWLPKASGSLKRDLQRLWQLQAADLRWIAAQRPGRKQKEEGAPGPGRFNGAQKGFTVVSAAVLVLLIITGIIMWQTPRFPAPLAQSASALHDLLTFLLLPLVAGHMALALVIPSTRPALWGMLSGWVDAGFARKHHPRWEPPAKEKP